MVRRVGIGALAAAAMLFVHPVRAQPCPGDCDGNGQVGIDELVRGVSIALGALNPDACVSLDIDGDGAILVHELIAAVGSALRGCAEATATPTATDTGSPTASPTPTTDGGDDGIADAVVRAADGSSARLGEERTVEGVVTVAAGVFANNKLKVFLQESESGILLYHETSADAEAFAVGDRVRATGIIRQMDPTSDNNPATGTVHLDISDGSATILSQGNPLPEPQVVTLAGLAAGGAVLAGELVRVTAVAKVNGDWPGVGSRSTQVTISDDGGATNLILRLQRNTITASLVAELEAIDDGPFTLTAIVVQDDPDGLPYDNGYELWLRGAADVDP
jgi:hypothetical protein